MRHFFVLIACMAFMVMTGCGALNPFPQHVYSTPPSSKSANTKHTPPKNYDAKTNPYTVLGKRYYPLKTAAGYDEVGMASWYGKEFHGKKTANGYIYNMYGVSAAHKTLPLGTQVQVTNLENNRSVVLVVNDRGPFVHGRILDLSYGAAKELGSIERGVVKVRIMAVGSIPASTLVASKAMKSFHVRVGAFGERSNAERALLRLREQGYEEANITTISRDGQILYIVQAGSFSSRDKAERVLEQLKDAFPTSYIIS